MAATVSKPTAATSTAKSQSASTPQSTSTPQSNQEVSFNDFLFIGDSRYAGISGELKKLGTNASVCAVSGSTPKQWLETTANGSGKVKEVNITLPTSASGISVMLGVNATTQVSELEQVFENLHSRYPNAMIYYSSAYHIAANYTVIDKSTMNANIDSFNESIKAYCGSNDWIEYVDISNNLYDDDGYLLNGDSSGIHLTGEGRNQLVDNIISGIKGSGKSSNTSNSSTANTNSNSTYKLVVASSTTVDTNKVNSYEYTRS